MSLDVESVHIFVADPAMLNNGSTLARVLKILNDEERRRFDRFIFDADKRAFAAAHGLVRLALSRFASVAPADWEFENLSDGRPELAAKFAAGRLRFNLSHSRGLVACVVADTIDCGIDVERFLKVKDPLRLAQRFFNEREYAHLAGLKGRALDRRFVELWTLKEAYVKAKGQGLRLSLSSFWYDVADDMSVTVHVDPSEQPRAHLWNFLLTHADEAHAMGVAVVAASGHPVKFEVERVIL